MMLEEQERLPEQQKAEVRIHVPPFDMLKIRKIKMIENAKFFEIWCQGDCPNLIRKGEG